MEALVSLLEKTDFKIAYSDAYRAFQHKQGDEYVISKRDKPFSFDFDYSRILIENFIPVLCVIHEKECLQKAGIFDENLCRLEDWDLWIRMSRHYEFAHLKEITCEFRWRKDGSSMMTGPLDAFAWASMNMLYKYSDIVKNSPNITRTHKQMIATTIATLKKSMIEALASNLCEQVHISLGNDIDSIVSKLSELRGKYPENLGDIDEMILLLHRMEESTNRNREQNALTNHFNSDDRFEAESQNSLDTPTLLSDQLVIKDEYIRSLESRIHRLDNELNNIQKSHGWRLLTKYYKARNLLTDLKR